MIQVKNAAEPIEIVVDAYFRKKRMLDMNNTSSSMTLEGNCYTQDQLPNYPVQLIRNDSNQVYKIIYGDTAALLEEENSVEIWQEEIVRDSLGKVTNIITTLPDGLEIDTLITRNAAGAVERLEV